MVFHPDDDDKPAVGARLFHDAVNVHDFGAGCIHNRIPVLLQLNQYLFRDAVRADDHRLTGMGIFWIMNHPQTARFHFPNDLLIMNELAQTCHGLLFLQQLVRHLYRALDAEAEAGALGKYYLHPIKPSLSLMI